jgi:hypothetical protein
MIDGLPIRAIAVDNLRLLPPEYCFTGRSAQSVRPSRFNKHSAIYKNKKFLRYSKCEFRFKRFFYKTYE